MACTAMFGNGTGNGWGGLGPTPTDLKKEFKLKQVELGVLDRVAYDLLAQFSIIADLAKVRNIYFVERMTVDASRRII